MNIYVEAMCDGPYCDPACNYKWFENPWSGDPGNPMCKLFWEKLKGIRRCERCKMAECILDGEHEDTKIRTLKIEIAYGKEGCGDCEFQQTVSPREDQTYIVCRVFGKIIENHPNRLMSCMTAEAYTLALEAKAKKEKQCLTK